MTGAGDEPDDHGDDELGLDEPRPPSTTTDPVQDPIEWDAQSEKDRELQGALNELRPPSTTTDPVQDSVDHSGREDGDEPSGEEDGESDAVDRSGDGL